jgi:stearoyl-CoA desaturase (delta-9 desaturase)
MSEAQTLVPPSPLRRVLGLTPFWAVHVAAVALVIKLGFSWKGFAIAIACYYFRMFWVTGAYHRYFSHRTYKTSRWFQLVMAVFALTTFQKGVLWWAAHHRVHHKYSDQEGDLHSMKRDGFWRSHVGWILDWRNDGTDLAKVADLAKYPELVWLDKWWFLPPLAWSVASYAIGGLHGLVWATGVSTVLLWHGTFTINSLSHWMGRVRYKTTDESKNSVALAIVTMGEGWHNNHHFYQRATNQGFFWWEIDLTYYVLRLFQAVGLIWDVHTPPRHVRDAHLRTARARTKSEPEPLEADVPLALPSPADAE